MIRNTKILKCICIANLPEVSHELDSHKQVYYSQNKDAFYGQNQSLTSEKMKYQE